MSSDQLPGGIEIFATTPQSKDWSSAEYLQQVANVARWSEQYGCKGILVYADNGICDPWVVSNVILQNTTALCPLVAVQPAYMHPYTVAKMISSYAFMYGRRFYVNMIAGGFKNDLLALNDQTPHDDRYVRLTEYTQIIQDLLESPAPVNFDGQYYKVENLKMTPQLPEDLQPGVLISGSSPAGLAAASAIGATPIKYPQRTSDEAKLNAERSANNLSPAGVRVGIIARETSEEAWQVAHERFPADRKGQIAHKLAMKTSDSQWHRQLSEMAAEDADKDDPYWLGPFENYRTFCPYLVGSYERVAQELQAYIEVGYGTFILDIPPSEEELQHTSIAFQEALVAAHAM
jgi:alkanesulfonate monooxygenase